MNTQNDVRNEDHDPYSDAYDLSYENGYHDGINGNPFSLDVDDCAEYDNDPCGAGSYAGYRDGYKRGQVLRQRSVGK